MTTCS